MGWKVIHDTEAQKYINTLPPKDREALTKQINERLFLKTHHSVFAKALRGEVVKPVIADCNGYQASCQIGELQIVVSLRQAYQ